MEKKKRNYLLIIIVFATMLSISISENTKGIFVPVFKATFNINDANMGTAFLFISLAYVVGSYLAGHVIDMISRKKTMILGTFILILGTLMIASTKSVWLFYLSLALSNFGMAFMALAVNTLIPKLNVKSTAVIMNLVHFSYGLGATATHKSCGILLSKGFTYSQIYYMLLVLVAFVLILILFTKFKKEEQEKKSDKIKFHRGEKKLIIIMSIGLGLYVSAELQTGNWFVDYIMNTFSYNENSASNYSSMFFLFFASGRLLGGFVAEKFGYLRSVIISTSIATILYTIGLSLGVKGLLLISISGIFFSIVFPIVILSVNDYFKESLNRASGIIVTIASATNMAISFIFGNVSELIGIDKTMYMIPIFLLTSTILILMVKKKGYILIKKEFLDK